ncbi:dethiobiotin synthase [Ammonifex degensii KC4]|uniref:ATP-dependent dethiobiotin synthetase BioD n=1 Tax=Ammonifex degensii (strain DSM 10501 / KC4) TaxID=429009 RepID=C9R9E3_AMMDK|nr:dethiobiotin synthase [Ammonifex degensii]ACX52922.1 dethiobiotin synthase [Ammonifex degensii KC4]
MTLPSLFVTGTDTEVGKTVVSALLGLIYRQEGMRVAYLKPVATGGNADPSFVARILELDEPQDIICPYVFEQPFSPHLAARLAGRQIRRDIISECYAYLAKHYDAVIVEGAGGLMVPLGPSYLIADLARDLGLPLLVVARPGLGTINHTLLTLATALQAGLSVAGVVINRYPRNNPDSVAKDNPRIIASFSGLPVLALVPEIEGLDLSSINRKLLEEVAAEVTRQHPELLERLRLFGKGEEK